MLGKENKQCIQSEIVLYLHIFVIIEELIIYMFHKRIFEYMNNID